MNICFAATEAGEQDLERKTVCTPVGAPGRLTKLRGVESLALFDRLDELMAEAKPIPFTSDVRMDLEEVYGILDELRTALPDELDGGRWAGREHDEREGPEWRWGGREDDEREGPESQLRQIGASIAELRKAQHSQAQRHSSAPPTPAEAEQVREIIEAAKATASRLEAEAASKARAVKEEAQSELRGAREKAERIRHESPQRAADAAAAYVRRVEEATTKMLERAAHADSEMDGMLARLQGSEGSVIEDLEAMVADLNEIKVRRSKERRDPPKTAGEGRNPTPPPRPDSEEEDEPPAESSPD